MNAKRTLLIISAVVGVALLAAGGAGFWFLQEAGTSETVTSDAAVAEFTEGDDGTRDVEGAPAPGVYVYDATGTETGRGGPVSVSRDLPLEAQMIVWQRPGGYTSRLIYSGDHLEEADHTITEEGVAQTRVRTKLTVLGTTTDDETPLSEPQIWIPADPQPGMTWSGGYEADGYGVALSSEVTGTETLQVAGQPVETVVVERTTTYSGGITGGWTDTYWWSPELSLPVKLTVSGESKQGIGSFSQETSITLRSATPITE